MNWIDVLYYAGWALLMLAVLAGLWRVVFGPSTLDRLLGFDTAMIAMLAIVLLVSVRERTDVSLELVLVLTGLGFFTTVAYFYYLSRSPEDSEDFDQGKEDA